MRGRYRATGILLLAAAAALWCAPSAARAEAIQAFQSDVTIRPDATVHVTETIVYDFEGASRHGIYRDMPYRYRTNAGNYSIGLDNITAEDKSGEPYEYTMSRNSGAVRIRIGDPDVTITGVHTYVIEYDVSDALSYFDTYDEVYWNVTGHEWDVPIAEVRGTVRFLEPPGGVGVGVPSILQASCYRGAYGADSACRVLRVHDGETGLPYLEYEERTLGPREGVTIAVAFPKGYARESAPGERLLKTLKENGVLALPVLALLVMWRLWLSRGRDPKGRGTIVAEYEPPKDMTPLELGGLVDEGVHAKDISAEIVHLAVEGYLKIHQVERKKLLVFNTDDYILEKLKPPFSLRNDFDRKIMDALFDPLHIRQHEANGKTVTGVALSDLAHKLQSDMSKMKELTYKALVAKKYFARNPRSVRAAYVAVGVLFAIAGVVVVSTGALVPPGALATASTIASGLIIAIFGVFMPARTREGVLAREHILGLKKYLSVAEKDRLAFHNSPKQTPELFDTLLPYAIALGVEKEWAAQFAALFAGRNETTWYAVPYGHAFTPALIASDLTKGFSSAVAAASAPQGGSGSGGGGFSGGGFGGGGGGSW